LLERAAAAALERARPLPLPQLAQALPEEIAFTMRFNLR
jgi:hypothetical protein